MVELVSARSVHIVGAGGAGMSGLAKLLAQAGHVVSGSDLKPGRALSTLRASGVDTWVGHKPELMQGVDLVVASSAVPQTDPEISAATAAGVEVWERPRLLSAITEAMPALGVTGTHGKTTSTAMLVEALRSLGRDPSFMVGGELLELGTNAHLGESSLFVLETDEAFGTFLGVRLGGLVVTNIEPDHLDYYGTVDALRSAFVDVAERVDGPVIACLDDPGSRWLGEQVNAIGYGTSDDASWRVEDLSHLPGTVRFHLAHEGTRIPVEVSRPGLHVALNAAGVLALLGELGADVRTAAVALSKFGGVRRRFEIRSRRGGVMVVEDYAHHPTEVRATIEAASVGHDGRIVAVFQPHRFTRTEEHAVDLGQALSTADVVVVSDVYAAGEAPIPGVTGRLVADAAAGAGAAVEYVPRRADVAAHLAEMVTVGDVVLVMGAGDIALVADELPPLLSESN